MTACSTGDAATTKADKGSQSQSDKPAGGSAQLTADDFAQRISDAQYKAGSAHVVQTIEVSGKKVETTGDIIVDKDPAKIRMSTVMTGGIEMRMVDGEVYLKMGELTGGKFYQAPDDGSNPIAEQLKSSTDQVEIGKQLEALQVALKDIKATPDADTIDGVSVTKYTLTLDPKKMFAALKTDIPQGADLGDTISYDMYVGSDDLLRRMVMDIAGTAMTMDYSKWGEPVTIEAPPADQITDKMVGM